MKGNQVGHTLASERCPHRDSLDMRLKPHLGKASDTNRAELICRFPGPVAAAAAAVQSGRPMILPATYTSGIGNIQNMMRWDATDTFYSLRSTSADAKAGAIATELVRRAAFPTKAACATVDAACPSLHALVASQHVV